MIAGKFAVCFELAPAKTFRRFGTLLACLSARQNRRLLVVDPKEPHETTPASAHLDAADDSVATPEADRSAANSLRNVFSSSNFFETSRRIAAIPSIRPA